MSRDFDVIKVIVPPHHSIASMSSRLAMLARHSPRWTWDGSRQAIEHAQRAERERQVRGLEHLDVARRLAVHRAAPDCAA
jgi:hypothetical protein